MKFWLVCLIFVVQSVATAQIALLGPEQVRQNERRIADYKAICAIAKDVTKKNSDAETRRIVNLLCDNAELVSPVPDGLLRVAKPAKKPSFFLLIALPEDKGLVDFGMGHFEAGIQYEPKNHIVTIRGTSLFSPRWLTYRALHEVYHYETWRTAESG